MKTIATLLVGIFAASVFASTENATQGDRPKNVEVTVAAAFPTGDVKDDLNGNTGWMIGIDNYWYGMGSNTKSFFGARAYWVGSDNDMRAIGAHWGVRFDMNQSGMGNGKFYGKAAVGYYSSNFDIGGGDIADMGLGGFLAVGWEMGGHSSTPWGLELGYYWLPEVSSVNNTGWYAGATFKF